MSDIFIIIPDSNPIHINPRVHEKEIVVSPCGCEHWISTDLFKFRIYAEREQLHVIGICSANQVPLYSLFCDEIVLVKANQTWYADGDCPISQNGNIVEQTCVDIEFGEFRSKFISIADLEVIERFAYRKIYFLESSYNKFLEVKNELLSNIVIVEFKKGFIRSVSNLEEYFPVAIGVNHDFQRNLVKKVGSDNYLTIQIMSSSFLNWQFLCCGGSSNLLCVVPVKLISIQDPTINDSTIEVVKGFSKKRYNFDHIPYINKTFRINFDKNRSKRVGPQGLQDIEQIKSAFGALSQFDQSPKVIYNA